MRRLFYHVVTSLVLEVVGEDALLNETVAEIERRALEERRTSPRYVRGKEVRRRGYARYRFLKGFKVSLRAVDPKSYYKYKFNIKPHIFS